MSHADAMPMRRPLSVQDTRGKWWDPRVPPKPDNPWHAGVPRVSEPQMVLTREVIFLAFCGMQRGVWACDMGETVRFTLGKKKKIRLDCWYFWAEQIFFLELFLSINMQCYGKKFHFSFSLPPKKKFSSISNCVKWKNWRKIFLIGKWRN